MYSEREKPATLSGNELDQYLSKGWYRMGQAIFTTWFLNINKEFYSTLWLRLDLNGFRFSKSQRKLLRKNGAVFRYEFKDECLDEEKEALFDKYKSTFKGRIYPSLKQYLYDNEPGNIFNSKEINVYHNDKLIAYSFFDLGQNSMASIQGVFDPDYQQYSLGYYTMLLEMVYGMEHHFKFYYPGYVVPGNPRFDYKSRIGNVDYFEAVMKRWVPFKELPDTDVPLEILKSKLDILYTTFSEAGIDVLPVFYPFYEASTMFAWETRLLDHPLFVMRDQDDAPYNLVVTYDLKLNKYVSFLCYISSDYSVNPAISRDHKYSKNYLILSDILETAVVFPPTASVEHLIEVFKSKTRF